MPRNSKRSTSIRFRIARSTVNYFRLIYQTFNLDIFELNPTASYPEFEKGLLATLKPYRRPHAFLPRTLGFAAAIARSAKSVFENARPIPFNANQPLFVASTTNQKLAIRPIFDEMTTDSFWFDEQCKECVSTHANRLRIPFIPLVMLKALLSKGYRRKSFRHSVATYCEIHGTYLAFRLAFASSRPSCIVISNDHSAFFRTLEQAARHSNIPTIYVQHACVAEHFPPLNFDYALLDGQDAAEKYANKASRSKVFLVGISKYSKSENESRWTGSPKRIGLCCNALDQTASTIEIITTIQKSLPDFEIHLRLHPSTPASEVDKLIRKCPAGSVVRNDAKTVNSFAFCKSVDVIICGPSSMMLEAAMAETPVITVETDSNTDVYGFQKHGLCQTATSAHDLSNLIADIETRDRGAFRKAISYFCEGFNSPSRPQASSLAATLIENISNRQQIPTNWKQSKKHGWWRYSSNEPELEAETTA
ncbi:hypothetical protein K227x_18830 [Rubripirellula lacrimiformis]|uniref:Uncharacterized protein n=1 Tax=Rubripirellula lacrimiformis TaxID=1930273 RepID=A0A517N8P4_9BACT|nr:hypothetical protein [Rubripirellula lacrimiformis]QDT03499.1 hypothetical protein K227x_18830 [Rubripirellula lacrimiformis]